MNKIGIFLLKFNGFFVFIILEFFSLYIYFTQNINQEKSAFLGSSNRIVGNVYDYTNRWMRYWNLAAVNDSLAKENARLKMKMPNSQYNNLIASGDIQDTFNFQQYNYTEAQVINNSVNKKKNYLTINRGKLHGIKTNCGVLNANGDGIIGITIAVSQHFSSVMSILHEDTRVSAKIKRNGFFGVLTWDGSSAQKLTLEAIPKHAKIMIGDSIITSGFSSIFPEGVLVGRIESFKVDPGSNFYNIKVALAADLNNVQYINVVDDLMREERKKIQGGVNNE
jgi:rod shape-determining protein MreC